VFFSIINVLIMFYHFFKVLLLIFVIIVMFLLSYFFKFIKFARKEWKFIYLSIRFI